MASAEHDAPRFKEVVVTRMAGGSSFDLEELMQKLDEKTLDEIGRALVKTDAVSSREIERITEDPALFDSVLARIKLAERQTRPRRIFFTKTLVGSFASIAFVTAIAFGYVVLSLKPAEVAVIPVPEAPKTKVAKRFTDPDRFTDTSFAPAPTPIRSERISTRSNIKADRPKEPAAQQTHYEGDFYALSYAGDPNETERGGRIVRVDVPRSTLFAMGVDIPLENEAETVKADLLIGSDGVTRAIRVVK